MSRLTSCKLRSYRPRRRYGWCQEGVGDVGVVELHVGAGDKAGARGGQFAQEPEQQYEAAESSAEVGGAAAARRCGQYKAGRVVEDRKLENSAG